MFKKAKSLIIAIALPLLVGFLSSFATMGNIDTFDKIIKPPFTPPAEIFPIAWTFLFILMGIASFLVYTSDSSEEKINNALSVYAAQLFINFFWSIFFFNFELYLFSFFWLVLLWVFIVFTILLFYKISKIASFLLLPYLLWVSFAGYLNFAIFLIN